MSCQCAPIRRFDPTMMDTMVEPTYNPWVAEEVYRVVRFDGMGWEEELEYDTLTEALSRFYRDHIRPDEQIIVSHWTAQQGEVETHRRGPSKREEVSWAWHVRSFETHPEYLSWERDRVFDLWSKDLTQFIA